MTDAALLLRPVPQRRHCVADRVLDTTGPAAARPDGGHIVAWWELVDPASPDDLPPLGLVATRHRDEGVVEILRVVLTPFVAPVTAPGRGDQRTDPSEPDDLPVRLLRSLADMLRAGSPARMLCAPVPVPDGLRPDLLVAAGFAPGGPGGPATSGYVLEL